MASVPGYLNRIPVVAGLFRREMQRYLERHGETADFQKGWWHPPVSPAAVLDSEVAQITNDLGLTALVSITDHDSITAGLSLRARHPESPISFEWTVPFHEGFFHLGVHNLPPDDAPGIFDRLQAFTNGAAPALLSELLAGLDSDRRLLVVFNHPMWDLAGVGPLRHRALLDRFLGEYGAWLHALEVNGYRAARENARVGRLASRVGLPLVSGGDRHGYAPNSLLNLTTAGTFEAFVREVREARVSEIAVMPQYGRSLGARKLAVAADVIRANRRNPPGQRHWMDRVSYDRKGVVTPLSRHWPTGGPLWVRSTIRLFLVLTSAPLLPALAFMMTLVMTPAPRTTSPQTSARE
jgi:hypothetical protein